MRRRLITAGVLLGLGVLAWMPLTSLLLIIRARLWTLPPERMVTYAYAVWQQYRQVPSVMEALQQAAIVSAALSVAPAVYALLAGGNARLREARLGEAPPRPRRANSSAQGAAEWLSLSEVIKRFPGGHLMYGGIAVGEAYRVDLDRSASRRFDTKDPSTWGKGGRAPLLVEPCTDGSTHWTVVAGSGGMKTASVTIPTMLTWTGSAVVFDPPNQIGPMMARARKAMGHRVYTVGPGHSGINVLSWIDINSPSAELDVADVLEWVCATGQKDSGENADFRKAARMILGALLADMLWDPDLPPSQKTLRELRRRVVMPERKLQGFLQTIMEESRSGFARDNASALFETTDKTFSGAAFSARTATDFLAFKQLADMVSNADFDPRVIVERPATVFIAIPMDVLGSHAATGRTVLAAFQSVLRKAEGRVATERVLFLLEEARFLGRLSTLASMLTADRKYGATILSIWQGEGDLKAIWGDNAGIFSTNSVGMIYAAIDGSDDTAKRVSDRIGTYTVLSSNTSRSRPQGLFDTGGRGINEGLSEASRPLLSPQEVRQMRADEAIIFARGLPPIRIGRPVYFRRQEMNEAVDRDRFAAGSTSVVSAIGAPSKRSRVA